ncbi:MULTISPECIES: hypothetical protein [Bacteroidales]|uniref:hypothetical protein n=1 Tax=Bacteroidales TaxID=171549 RepID=UPI002557FACB|nr:MULTISPECIES: hypothetical protein [Bacteroidales]
MKRAMVMLLAVIVCSLSAWSQPQLLRLAGELLEHFDDVSKVEKTFEDNGLSVVSKEFDKYVACSYYLSASNSDSIPPIEAEFSRTCDKNIAVVIFNIDLDSDYYNTLNDQLAEYGFALIEDDGNELIYRNEKQIQCNIMFPKNGKARIYVVQRTNRVW